jgi:hypothetical protein
MSPNYSRSMPEKIIESMEIFLKNKINDNKDIFRYDISRLDIGPILSQNWTGIVISEGIINRKGISDLRIKSLDSITAKINVYYDDDKVATFIMIYFNDDNIIVNEFEIVMHSMNVAICDKCRNHTNKCTCKNRFNGFDDKVKDILTMIRPEEMHKTSFYDPEEILFEERRDEPVEKPEEKPKIDLAKFEPIIKGISTTLRYNQKKVEETAIIILTSNPDIPDNQLATEIIKKIRG